MSDIHKPSMRIKKFIRLCNASALLVALGLASALSQAAPTKEESKTMTSTSRTSETLSTRQQAIVPIAAFAAAGDMTKLDIVLNEGLDAGLTISDVREVLLQLYAYAGFPRSLNALGELMKVVASRKEQGIDDALGQAPSHGIPTGEALLAAGTANQTKLSGGPVKGALFDFAPAANEHLRTHLFGDIFERDNLDWKSRELATVSMLAAMPGVDAQLQAHMRISMNVGISVSQLQQLAQVLADRVGDDAAQRAHTALESHLAAAGEN